MSSPLCLTSHRRRRIPTPHISAQTLRSLGARCKAPGHGHVKTSVKSPTPLASALAERGAPERGRRGGECMRGDSQRGGGSRSGAEASQTSKAKPAIAAKPRTRNATSALRGCAWPKSRAAPPRDLAFCQGRKSGLVKGGTLGPASALFSCLRSRISSTFASSQKRPSKGRTAGAGRAQHPCFQAFRRWTTAINRTAAPWRPASPRTTSASPQMLAAIPVQRCSGCLDPTERPSIKDET